MAAGEKREGEEVFLMGKRAKQILIVSCMAIILTSMAGFSNTPDLSGKKERREDPIQEEKEEIKEEVIADQQIRVPDSVPWEDIPLSEDEQIMMYEMCKQMNISYAFALAIMESESGYDPEAVGDGGKSIGYFQINSVNWPRMEEEYGLNVSNRSDNIAAGIYILAELFEKYKDPYLVIECYKCGERRGKELFEQGIYKTKDFDCEEICARSKEIEESHGL